ncbi:guanine nucleotide binding protein, alpha subunit [Gorgonomyces haynaldii]|nr:guanine nucleotide binding protein, alpha subunit [Gorgonomyces haynaldii]
MDLKTLSLSKSSSQEEQPYPSVVEQLKAETATEKKDKARRSREIDAYLKEEASKMDPRNHLTILLLGPGDSGKSTVLKQMTLLHGNGFTDEDRDKHSRQIQEFVFVNIQRIVRHIHKERLEWGESLPVTLAAKELETLELTEEGLTDKHTQLVLTIASCHLFQAKAQEWETLGLHSSAEYFFKDIKSIMAKDYKAKDKDILNFRKKTEYISETIFEIEKKFWHIIDVAGQKDKRSRWTSYMEKRVSGVMYVFSCAAYNEQMEEEQQTNRIMDALTLFAVIASDKMLKLTSIIALFNKYDLLEYKISKYKIKDYLKNYTGIQQKRQYVEWLQDQFYNIGKERNVKVYTHKTTATDRTLMRNVIDSVKDNMLRMATKDYGFTQ